MADVLTFEFVARFGAPMEIHTDQGRNFCSRIMQEVCELLGDYFTKWIEAYPIPNQEAKTVADVLTFEFVARFGAPMEIHTDQGRNFCSRIMQEVCELLE